MAGRNGRVTLKEQVTDLRTALDQREGELAVTQATQVFLQERILELERHIDGWVALNEIGLNGREFSRDALKKISATARLLFIANPIVKRAVTVQSFYVWGQGVQIQAHNKKIQAVIDAFIADPKNQAELTSHEARTLKEQSLQVEGNIFFVLFTNPETGHVQTRTIPPDEIDTIICNPDDAKEPWYYKRVWHRQEFDASGRATSPQRVEEYYPDWRYHPEDHSAGRDVAGANLSKIDGKPVHWDAPIYHRKTGGLPEMRFGVPETFAAQNWATAYKSFLEDVATLMKSYARFAGQLQTKGGSRGVKAAKTKLTSTVGVDEDRQETNPPPVAGSMLLTGEGIEYRPFNLRGASVNPEDGRRLLLMVCAAVGLPETFFGDVQTGNLATARSLDRPTELQFRDRQTLWSDTFRDIFDYVIDQSALAPKGYLDGKKEMDPIGGYRKVVLDPDPDDPMDDVSDEEKTEPRAMDRTVNVTFPPILEHDVDVAVRAVVEGATLGGHPLAETMDPDTATRLILQAIGEDDIDGLVAKIKVWRDKVKAEQDALDQQRQDQQDRDRANMPSDREPGEPPDDANDQESENQVMLMRAVADIRELLLLMKAQATAGEGAAVS